MLQYLSGVINTEQNKNTYKKNNQIMNNHESMGIIYPQSIGKISLKNVTKAVQSAVQNVASTAQTAVQNVASTVQTASQNVAQTAQSAVQNATSNVKAGTKNLVSTAQSATQSVQNAGQQLVSTVQNIKVDPKALAHNIAKVQLLIPRGAVLVCIRAGELTEKTPLHFNLAQRLADAWSKKGTEIKDFWYNIGGEPSELINIINMASKTKISGVRYLGEPVTVAASVATATPFIVKLMDIIGKASDFAEENPKLVAQGQALLKGAMDNIKKDNPEQAKQFTELQASINNAVTPSTQAQAEVVGKTLSTGEIVNLANQTASEISTVKANESTSTGNNKMLIIGIVGAVALLGTVILLKKK